MKRYKILSLIICVIIGVALVSCGSDSSNEKPTIDEYGVCIDQEVDLGLPSGKIWAGWNIGATSPEEYGDYFSWGETQPKSNYTFDSYMHTEYSPQTYNHDYVNIGCEISATKYDAAQYMWGSDWRMPTKTELEELVYECTWEDFEYKGVKGFLITGPNEVSMFLPAAGVIDGADLHSDRQVHDASYLRLKNVNLGYTLNVRSKAIKEVKFVLSGENLYLWKYYNGFDPDVSSESDKGTIRRMDLGAYPKPRTVIFSVQPKY